MIYEIYTAIHATDIIENDQRLRKEAEENEAIKEPLSSNDIFSGPSLKVLKRYIFSVFEGTGISKDGV